MQENKCSSNQCKCSPIHSLAFGFSGGVIYGLSLFILAAIAAHHPWPASLVNGLANFYIGYSASWQGAFYGLLLGFIDFFVFAYLWALLYNFSLCLFSRCYKACCCKDGSCKTCKNKNSK